MNKKQRIKKKQERMMLKKAFKTLGLEVNESKRKTYHKLLITYGVDVKGHVKFISHVYNLCRFMRSKGSKKKSISFYQNYLLDSNRVKLDAELGYFISLTGRKAKVLSVLTDEDREKINIKNEFIYKHSILSDSKKSYTTMQSVQEFN